MDSSEVENSQIQELLTDIGRTLKRAMPEGWGFTLLLFDYAHPDGETGAMFYLSSAQRADMRKALTEFLAKDLEEAWEKINQEARWD